MLVALAGDYGKPRPAVVVQADILTESDCSSVVVCPLTTALSNASRIRVPVEPSEENGLAKASEIMTEKIAGVPRHRIRETIGRLESDRMRLLERALLLVLGFASADL